MSGVRLLTSTGESSYDFRPPEITSVELLPGLAKRARIDDAPGALLSAKPLEHRVPARPERPFGRSAAFGLHRHRARRRPDRLLSAPPVRLVRGLGAAAEGDGVPRDPRREAAPGLAPAGYTEVESACDDDSSGDAWLSAERLYSSKQSKAEILEHYTKAAAADGWKLEEDTSPRRAPADVAGLCFSKGGDGNAMMLTVTFPTGDKYRPAPDFGAGTGVGILVGAEIDGSPTPCWD